MRLRFGGATIGVALLGCGIWLLVLDIRGPALPWHARATITYAMTFIALGGDSGGTTRPELYFEIRKAGHPVDPRPWFKESEP